MTAQPQTQPRPVRMVGTSCAPRRVSMCTPWGQACELSDRTPPVPGGWPAPTSSTPCGQKKVFAGRPPPKPPSGC